MALTQRDSWKEAYQLAVSLAVQELATADLAERCRKTGATWMAAERFIEIPSMNRTCRLVPPTFELAIDGGEAADIREQIVLLHHLQKAGGSPLSGEWISFSQIPGGQLYLANFRARSCDRLARTFGDEPVRLRQAASVVAGVAAEAGDAGVRIPALPRVPLLALVWGGDDEFPASGDILFDSSVTDYLPTEDMIVLAEQVVTRLCRWDRENRS